MTEPLILLVEDEQPLVEVIRYNLEREGYRTAVANDGEEALLLMEEEPPDLVILDWMLPKLSGIEVCRQIRQQKHSRRLPVIMLTARGEESDRVRGLDAGADDYVTKPFSPKELNARVRAILRRTRPADADERLSRAPGTATSSHGPGRAPGRARRAPGPVGTDRVPPAQGPDGAPGPRARERLLDAVWGRDVYVEPRTVDVHILRLRKALNAGGRADVIRTVRGVGYALDADAT